MPTPIDTVSKILHIYWIFKTISHQIYSFHFFLHFSDIMNISEQLSLFFFVLFYFQFPRLRARRSQRRWRRSALQKMAPTSSPPEIGKCRFFQFCLTSYLLDIPSQCMPSSVILTGCKNKYKCLQACKILVPWVLAEGQIQGACASHGQV